MLEFGYVGQILFNAVERERKSSGNQTQGSNRPTVHIPQVNIVVLYQILYMLFLWLFFNLEIIKIAF